jgi:hypothetical protein
MLFVISLVLLFFLILCYLWLLCFWSFFISHDIIHDRLTLGRLPNHDVILVVFRV